MTEPTAADRLFALIASIPGSGTFDWCSPARALLDEIAAAPVAVPPADRADCPRCRHDERTRGVLQLSALELYPPDHADDCPAGLRERIAGLFRHPPGVERLGDATPGEIADAVLSVLPEITRLHEEILTLQADQAKMRDLLRSENQRADAAIDRETVTEEAEEEQRLALSTALGLGTSAPWDAIRERAAELAVLPAPVDRAAARCSSCEHETRYHDVDDRCWFTVEQGVFERDAVCSCQLRQPAGTPQPETQAALPEARPECANCWREIENRSTPNMGGPSRDNWVHLPGGFTFCFPQRGADSPRAEPKPAVTLPGKEA
jgi:hypothetical protein